MMMMMLQVNCSAKEELWYHVPENVTLTRTTNTLTCQVSGGVQILFMNHCTIFANHWDMALTAISLESDNLVQSSFHYILLIPLPAPQVRNTTNCWLEPKAACKYVKWNECRWCNMLHVSGSGCYCYCCQGGAGHLLLAQAGARAHPGEGPPQEVSAAGHAPAPALAPAHLRRRPAPAPAQL